MKERLIVVNLDEIASRWQIPVEVLKTFIVEYGLNPINPAAWVREIDNWNRLIEASGEKFDRDLFPEKFRTSTATSAKIS